jgi:hypothetical protein
VTLRTTVPCGLLLWIGFGFGQNAQHDAVIQAVREYALNYTKRLPNYTCTLTTRHATSPPNAGSQRTPQLTTVEEQFSFANGKEIRAISRLDGRPVPAGTATPLLEGSKGEFGSFLDVIFEPATHADFRWDRLATLDGRKVDVLAFKVPQATGYVMTGSKGSVRVPFEGSVYADAETHAVLKVQMKCTMVPEKSEIRYLNLTLEYKTAQVAGQDFILPSHFLLEYYDRPDDWIHSNDGRYTAYHQFSAGAEIHFESVEPAGDQK